MFGEREVPLNWGLNTVYGGPILADAAQSCDICTYLVCLDVPFLLQSHVYQHCAYFLCTEILSTTCAYRDIRCCYRLTAVMTQMFSFHLLCHVYCMLNTLLATQGYISCIYLISTESYSTPTSILNSPTQKVCISVSLKWSSLPSPSCCNSLMITCGFKYQPVAVCVAT